MRKVFLGFIITALLAVSALTVTAQSVQGDGAEVTLSGSFGREVGGAEVSVYVFRKGKTAGDITEGTSQAGTLIYHNQSTADKEGKFSFVIGFPDDTTTDYYTAKIANAKTDEIITEEILFKSVKDILIASEALNEKVEKEDRKGFDEILDENALILGIGETFPEAELNKEDVYDMIYAYYSINKVDAGDTGACLEAIRVSETLCAVADRYIDDIFEYDSTFEIAYSKLKNFLKESYVTENFRKDVTERVAEMDIDNPGESIEYIYEAFVLEAVYAPGGYTNLVPLLKEFADEIGVKESHITSGVCRKIAGADYSDYSELEKAIDEAGKSNSGGSSGGGGGSSSGGGRVSSGKDVSLPTAQTEIPEEIPVDIFDDIDSVSWAKESIVALAQMDIISGKGDNKFFPNDYITREEFAKLITLAFFDDKEPAKINFVDVYEGEWYYDSVAVAFGLGIIKGIDETHFGTGERITRQDAAVMACRAAEAAGLWTYSKEEKKAFFDNAEISDYAKDAVYTLYGKGVVNGKGDSKFMPKDGLTRAETAKIIYALMQV